MSRKYFFLCAHCQLIWVLLLNASGRQTPLVVVTKKTVIRQWHATYIFYNGHRHHLQNMCTSNTAIVCFVADRTNDRQRSLAPVNWVVFDAPTTNESCDSIFFFIIACHDLHTYVLLHCTITAHLIVILFVWHFFLQYCTHVVYLWPITTRLHYLYFVANISCSCHGLHIK